MDYDTYYYLYTFYKQHSNESTKCYKSLFWFLLNRYNGLINNINGYKKSKKLFLCGKEHLYLDRPDKKKIMEARKAYIENFVNEMEDMYLNKIVAAQDAADTTTLKILLTELISHYTKFNNNFIHKNFVLLYNQLTADLSIKIYEISKI